MVDTAYITILCIICFIMYLSGDCISATLLHNNYYPSLFYQDKDEKHGCITSFQEIDERSIIDHELKLLRDLFVQKTKMV